MSKMTENSRDYIENDEMECSAGSDGLEIKKMTQKSSAR